MADDAAQDKAKEKEARLKLLAGDIKDLMDKAYPKPKSLKMGPLDVVLIVLVLLFAVRQRWIDYRSLTQMFIDMLEATDVLIALISALVVW